MPVLGLVFAALPAALALLRAQAAFIASLIALLTAALSALGVREVDFFGAAPFLAAQIFGSFSL